MEKVFGYNIYSYIMSIYGGKTMQLDGIISRSQNHKTFKLDSSVKEYLSYFEKNEFYISPNFEDIKTERAISSKNPKFVLFSAPGATGKSALAKHLAYKYKAIYWDLSKMKLGTNSFSGTIINAVGNREYSNFVDALNASETMLIIDALDEAEIISGRAMLGEFVNDISKMLTEYDNPNVVLLSRTETAQYIATYCAENKIPFLHYEIGYFGEDQAKEFIIKKENLTSSTELECVEEYYKVISKNIDANEVKSFLGYAPVLEAISGHIKEVKNTKLLLNELSSISNGVEIILKIMDDLLIREQEKKVCEALKAKFATKHPEFSDWTALYSKEEQLVRLVYYILFGDISYTNYQVEKLPHDLIDDYSEIINLFLPQHPFIRHGIKDEPNDGANSRFAGPAFRDYTLANLAIISEHSTLAKLYFDEAREEGHFPSQLFFEFYRKLNGNQLHADHLSLLYESFRSKSTAFETSYLQCSEVAENKYIAEFGVERQKQENSESIVMDMNLENNKIEMSQFINITFDLPKIDIVLNNAMSNARFTNSSIICKSISINVDHLIIESYEPFNCTLVCSENAKGTPKTIDIPYGYNISIDIPNITAYHKLFPYKFDFNTESIDIKQVIYAMRCILIEFRTHGKDTLAKDAGRIDNVTVGGGKLKRLVLDFFVTNEIIYKPNHLYKVDLGKMQGLGLSYLALIRGKYEQLNDAYLAFEKYYRENIGNE